MPEKKHILVVEDEEHLAVGIKFNLEAEGYRVTAVGDGASALKLIAELKVDRKFTAHQRELVNHAISQLTAIKAAWDATKVGKKRDAA